MFYCSAYNNNSRYQCYSFPWWKKKKKKFWNDSKDEKKIQFLGFFKKKKKKNSRRCLKINIFKKRKRKKEIFAALYLYAWYDIFFFLFKAAIFLVKLEKKWASSYLFVDVSSINMIGAETRCFLYISTGWWCRKLKLIRSNQY